MVLPDKKLKKDEEHTGHNGNVGHIKDTGLKESKFHIQKIRDGTIKDPVKYISNSSTNHKAKADEHVIRNRFHEQVS
jgi:hypothetical protein